MVRCLAKKTRMPLMLLAAPILIDMEMMMTWMNYTSMLHKLLTHITPMCIPVGNVTLDGLWCHLDWEWWTASFDDRKSFIHVGDELSTAILCCALLYDSTNDEIPVSLFRTKPSVELPWPYLLFLPSQTFNLSSLLPPRCLCLDLT